MEKVIEKENINVLNLAMIEKELNRKNNLREAMIVAFQQLEGQIKLLTQQRDMLIKSKKVTKPKNG